MSICVLYFLDPHSNVTPSLSSYTSYVLKIFEGVLNLFVSLYTRISVFVSQSLTFPSYTTLSTFSVLHCEQRMRAADFFFSATFSALKK